jgi:hypothetical protein
LNQGEILTKNKTIEKWSKLFNFINNEKYFISILKGNKNKKK